MLKKGFLIFLVVTMSFGSLLLNPCVTGAGPFGSITPLEIAATFYLVSPIPKDIEATSTPGDVLIQKVSLNMSCTGEWLNPLGGFNLNCTDGTNTFSVNYNAPYIDSSQAKSKSETIMVFLAGIFNSDINGVKATGGSASFLTGKENKDSPGNITSTTLSGNLYGGIDNDLVFQTNKIKITIMPQ